MKPENCLWPLLTPWGEQLDKECPLNEYPRPQLRRNGWQCLNGRWEYAIRSGDSAEPARYDGEIIVPFSPECLLSGVQKQLQPNETLWYRRSVHFEDFQKNGRLLLNFGAVDQCCTIYINGEMAGEHRGGYLPFTLDITALAHPGENRIVVAVTDASDKGMEAWGKQKLERGGIWYTAQSGIWQTVWCEWVPESYIAHLRITPQWCKGGVEVELITVGEIPSARIRVLDGETPVAEGETEGNTLWLAIPDFKSWSPDDPFLYRLEILAGEDTVYSYFGMREFGTIHDKDGHVRLALNGKPIFHTGLLDQGYWSDGMYTPPADEAMIWELEHIKAMGFNMLRKHIKIEPSRWYYHCDRLGIMVWQDFVSGGGPYKRSVTQVLPFLGIKLRDSRHKIFGRKSKIGRQNFLRDMRRTLSHLYNAPCIALWVPFNEGWGQFDALEVERQLRELDSTRPIDHASGWHDQGGGDLASYHIYYKRFKPEKNQGERALALTEFGGYSLPAPGHMATEKLFGYRVFDSRMELEAAIEQLYHNDVLRYLPDGLTAAVYTQVSDVEDEINGLFTYDRRQIKIDMERMRVLNAELTKEWKEE